MLRRITSSLSSHPFPSPSSSLTSLSLSSSFPPCHCASLISISTCTSTSTSPSPSYHPPTRSFATRVLPPKIAPRPTRAQQFAKQRGVPRPDALGQPTPEPAILPPVRYDHPYTNPRIATTNFPTTESEVKAYLEAQAAAVKQATITTSQDTETHADTSPPDPAPLVPLSFAIVDINNRQHKISAGDLLMIDRIQVDVGVSIVMHKVMLVGTQTYTIVGRPTIPGAEVHGTVEEHTFLAKTLIFHRKRRKNHRKWKGHRERVTMLRIDSVVIPEVASTAALPAPALSLPLTPRYVHVRTTVASQRASPDTSQQHPTQEQAQA